MKKPLVSIIIPVYNGSNYMREAIDSALAQTYSPIEIIVVNDGSNDNGATDEVARSYGDRIRYIYKENGGVSSALNRGISEMKGEYFSWLSHDDVYTPDKIQKQMETLSSDANSNEIVLCSCEYIDKNSQRLPDSKLQKYNHGEKLSWEQAVMHITKNSANGCALLIPKTVFDKCGGFDERLRYCQDIFMWWKIFLNKYTLTLCDHPGVLSRVHDKQLTQTGVSLYHKDAYTIGIEIAPTFASESTEEYNFLYEYSKGEAIHGNREVVKLCLELAKDRKLFSFGQKARLRFLNFYGRIRPLIRRVYYRVVKGIKTK